MRFASKFSGGTEVEFGKLNARIRDTRSTSFSVIERWASCAHS